MPAAPLATDPEPLLQPTFAATHVRAALKHFQAMTIEFQQGAWEEAIGKCGKFVEAALKALYVHAGKTLPPARQFKASNVMNDLEKLPAGSLDDSIRLIGSPARAASSTTSRATEGHATTLRRSTRTRWMLARWLLGRPGSWPKCSAMPRRAQWTPPVCRSWWTF